MNQKKHSNKIWKIAVIAIGLLISGTAISIAQQHMGRQKKLIELGWDGPDTAMLRKNLAEMEQTPFDGVILHVTGTDDAGKVIQVREPFSSVPWKKEWFQKSIDDLKAIHPKKLTDNFIQMGANPGNVDWFDDTGWKQVVDHWRIAAWIAKEGNLKGICFDPEPYAKPFDQLDYYAQANRDKHSIEAYQVKARQRGKEIIDAVAAVDPHLVIFTLYMNSANAIASQTPNPQTTIQLSSFNLYPAFINGWLDAAPASMVFVDGSEMASYYYNSRIQYLEGANMVRNNALSLIAPENQAKYHAQVQASSGFYLDAYINPPSSPWYLDPKGLTPTQQLGMNAHSAVEAADEYVWVYGEKYRWWPTTNPNVKPESWESVLPGITDTLWAATHPNSAIEKKIATLKQEGKLVNLIQNGNFLISQPDAVANWSTWQAGTAGSFSQDNEVNHGDDKSGSARLAGISEGCFIQSIKVNPGDVYVVQSWIRQQGQGTAYIRVRWQTPDGKWTNLTSDVMLFGEKEPDNNPWQKIQGKITVPEGSGNMAILLSVKHQLSPQDIVWFDDVHVYKTR